jgi:hypothetical protein
MLGPVKHAAGGVVGSLTGLTPGRADLIHTKVPSGSHVIPADVVAALGDGNTMSGLNRLTQFFSRLGKKKFALASGGSVNAGLSDGEFIVSPEQVLAVGAGNADAGHDLIDRLILNIRDNYIRHLAELPGPVRE